ncbi:hypothetical protein ACFYNF_14240 [Streptomyces sp. NPDC006641]|uniref:hypothetical protein n=1 Tax=unclassified Streptomyces TaxID=2593676 RepID=UPI0036A01C03
MDDRPSPEEARQPASTGSGRATPGQPGAIGIALGGVLTAALAQGAWQWFATYIGASG